MSEKNPPSFHAFIEQTARMLRLALSEVKNKSRKYVKETGLSNKNKIEQIARMLRTEASAFLKRKKKKKY